MEYTVEEVKEEVKFYVKQAKELNISLQVSMDNRTGTDTRLFAKELARIARILEQKTQLLRKLERGAVHDA